MIDVLQTRCEGRGRRSAAAVLGVIVAMALFLSANHVLAQADGAPAEPPAQQDAVQQQPQPEPAPPRNPGFLESFGRWFDGSVSGVGKGLDEMWQGAARRSSEAAKASTEATSIFAKGAADAAKGTVDVFGRLGTLGATRVAAGRERCGVSANGSPDCRQAVETLCKSKGFAAGNSMELETVERCPAQVLLSGKKKPGDCPVEHVVTKAMCQ